MPIASWASWCPSNKPALAQKGKSLCRCYALLQDSLTLGSWLISPASDICTSLSPLGPILKTLPIPGYSIIHDHHTCRYQKWSCLCFYLFSRINAPHRCIFQSHSLLHLSHTEVRLLSVSLLSDLYQLAWEWQCSCLCLILMDHVHGKREGTHPPSLEVFFNIAYL